jgi:hypothetical protein
MPRDCGSRRYRIPVSTADAILRVFRPMPWSLPHRRGDGGGHVQSQHIVKNRILGQLSADELKSVQPWLTAAGASIKCRAPRAGRLSRARLFSAEPVYPGDLNGSTQHSILKGKDGVFGNASRLFSRLYGIRENRALGSLAAGRVAESDWASVW